MSKAQPEPPKIYTARSRAKTLGEHKSGFLSINLKKGFEEAEPEYKGTVESYFELGVQIRDTEFITLELVKQWKIQLEASSKPKQSNAFIHSTLARMLGYESYRDLTGAVFKASNQLPNLKYKAITDDLVGRNKRTNKTTALEITTNFIKEKPGILHDGICPGKFKVESVLPIVKEIEHSWKKRGLDTFNHNDHRRFVNTVVKVSEFTIGRPWAQEYVSKLFGYESYQGIKDLMPESTSRVKHGRTLQEYSTLIGLLTAL